MIEIQEKSNFSGGISDHRVLNQDYYKQVKEITFKCNLCYNIIVNPFDCEKCGHSYCFCCINQRNCPFNCEKANIKPSSRGIKTILSKLILKCLNEGCQEKITYGKVIDHDKNCIYQKIKCPNCSITVLLKNLEEHKQINCKFCLSKSLNCNKEFNKNGLNKGKLKSSFVDENVDENNKEFALPKDYMKLFNYNMKKIMKVHEEKYKKLYDENLILKREIEEKLEISNSLENTEVNNEINSTEFKNNLEITLSKKINQKVLLILHENISHQIENGFNLYIKNLNNSEFNNTISLFFNESQTKIFKEFDSFKTKITEELLNSICHLEDCTNEKTEVNFEIQEQIDNILSQQNIQNKIITNYNENEEDRNESQNNEKINNLIESVIISLSDNIQEIFNDKIDNIKTEFFDLLNKNIVNFNENNESLFENLEALNKDFTYLRKDNEVIKLILQKEFNNINSNFSEKSKELIEIKFNSIIHNFFEIIKKIKNQSQNHLLNENSLDLNEIQFLLKSPQSKYAYELQQHIQELCKTQYSEILREIDVISKLNHSKKSTFFSLHEKLRETYFTIQMHLNNTIPLKITELNEFFIQEINSLEMSFIKKCTEQNYNENYENEMICEYVNVYLSKFLNDKLEMLEKSIDEAIYLKISQIFDLKWCGECSKVDYFFGFMNCEICLKEICKNCVVLCQECNKLYCKVCTFCSTCSQFYCLNCRKSCLFCEKETNDKYCPICIVKCAYCKKEACGDCKKLCKVCNTNTCLICSKTCNICLKCSCSRCDQFDQFKNCFSCKEIHCKDCVTLCVSCDYEICKNCLINCKDCKKSMCNRCTFSCEFCPNQFCKECLSNYKKISCSLCQKNTCNSCTINFKNCKKCKFDYCRNCCSICKRCKTLFCNNCNINCDNCNDFACYSCMYKCVCDELVFCENCLNGNQPIGPHECVYLINEAPTFSGIKTRSKIVLPKNFEAKFYLEKMDSKSLLIGITDNNDFIENTLTFIDNIYTFKVTSCEKYSSKFALQPYLSKKQVKEGDSIIVAVKNNQLFFRVNYDNTEPAFTIESNRKYYLYVENDSPNLATRVALVYIRKI